LQGPVQEARSSPAFLQRWAVGSADLIRRSAVLSAKKPQTCRAGLRYTLPRLPRGGVGYSSSLVPLADGRIHKRQCTCPGEAVDAPPADSAVLSVGFSAQDKLPPSAQAT
jgi:hypothetical protein